VLSLVLLASPLFAQERPPFPAAARGLPELTYLDGSQKAPGEYAQWLDGETIEVRLVYRFPDGRTIEEESAFTRRPLAQVGWAWKETRGEQVLRRFVVERKQFEEQPGTLFAGFGFSFAIQEHLKELLSGKTVELKAAAFTPKPRVAKVALVFEGVETLHVGGRDVKARRFSIRAELPGLVKKLAHVRDHSLWLTESEPAGFLRSEGALMEPGDPLIRVDVVPAR
jgi:hypothetical protein